MLSISDSCSLSELILCCRGVASGATSGVLGAGVGSGVSLGVAVVADASGASGLVTGLSSICSLGFKYMGAWVKNKKDQAFIQLSADTSDIIKKKGAIAGLKHAQAEINAWALDLKPSEKATKLRGIITADIDVAVAEGRFRDASRLLVEAEKYKIVGNATLFGSVKGKKEKATILARIESGLSRASREDQDDLEDEYAAIVGDAYGGLRGVETEDDISPAQRTQMLNSFQMLRPEADEATISEMFDKVFNGSGDPLQNYSSLLRETAVNGTDASARS